MEEITLPQLNKNITAREDITRNLTLSKAEEARLTLHITKRFRIQ